MIARHARHTGENLRQTVHSAGGISLGKFQEGFNAGIVMLVIAIADGDQH